MIQIIGEHPYLTYTTACEGQTDENRLAGGSGVGGRGQGSLRDEKQGQGVGRGRGLLQGAGGEAGGPVTPLGKYVQLLYIQLALTAAAAAAAAAVEAVATSRLLH